jgi:hypothetical protein
MRTYKKAEIEKMSAIIEKAKQMWDAASKEEFSKTGDRGSCIMGDGIEILYVPPRCRKPQKLMIIPSRTVAYAQGSLHYEATKDVALRFLEENGIECQYNYGRMD